MAAKDLKGALKGMRNTPVTTDARQNFGGLLRDDLEKQAERLPVEMIAIDKLHDNPYQNLARTTTDEAVQDEKLEELAESIRSNGFYGALLARTTPDGYQLAYGHRRREAARRAGLGTLPVKVLPLEDDKMARIMASENFSREDLSPLGEANVVGHLYQALNMSVREIATSIGKNRGWVQNRLDLFHAPQDLKQMVEDRTDSMTFVNTLAAVEDPVARETLAKEVVSKNLTREQLKQRLPWKIKSDIPNVIREKDNNQVGVVLSEIKVRVETLEQALQQKGMSLNPKEIEEIVAIIDRLEKLKN